MDVAVGDMGVAVEKGVLVATGAKDVVGVAVGVLSKDVQDERINGNRKKARMDGVNLFRMGCILPLVSKLIKSPPTEFIPSGRVLQS
jgi:hypothetical protein